MNSLLKKKTNIFNKYSLHSAYCRDKSQQGSGPRESSRDYRNLAYPRFLSSLLMKDVGFFLFLKYLHRGRRGVGREGGSNSCQLLNTNVLTRDKLMFEYE